MRYIIDVKTEQAQSWGTTFHNAEKRGELRILEKGDAELELSQTIMRIKDAVDTLKNAGISRALLESWLHDKTGLTKTAVSDLLDAQDSFFKQLGVNKQ